MPCLEDNRLRQHYEAALRHWGHVLLFPDTNLVGAAARQADVIKQKAFDERNAAKERLDAHMRVLPAFNRKLGGICKA
jgi:hypothetical protein